VPPQARPVTPLQKLVGFLFSEHSSRALLTSHRRYTRLVMLALITLLWWNLLAAPSLYGNCSAHRYFDQTFAAFKTVTTAPTAGLPLTAPFVVAATSLEKGQERYFLFVGDDADRDGRVSADAWFNLSSDPRWVTDRGFTDDDLKNVAFASGSPFPVFPAYAVSLPSLHWSEQLIDGGWAHNRPLDAARTLGVGKVLVLNSTPLAAVAEHHCDVDGWLKFGELSCNFPKLVPYLWSRSQVEDSLSSAGMLVASIYPTGADDKSLGSVADWPLLTDFRAAVVQRMVAAADHDLNERIGVIESWGSPSRSDTYSVRFHAAPIQRALAK
jgi:hypothetical protein